jgi:transglutaminase-like putative cysteine protease
MAASGRTASPDTGHWLVRLTLTLVETLRPYLGWLVLLGSMAVTIFPAVGLRMIGRQGLPVSQYNLEIIAPVAVLFTWLIFGWRRRRLDAPRAHWWVQAAQTLLATLLHLAAGALVLTQLVQRWLPTPRLLWEAARQHAWPQVGEGIVADLGRLGERYTLWWTGVQTGGAAQDNLVLLGLVGLAFWLLGLVTAWLARRLQQGLVAAMPSLGLLFFILLYTTRGRLVLVGALAAALFLYLVLDQVALRRRWEDRGFDYNPLVLLERLWAVVGISVLLLALAAVTPSIGSQRLAWWYYQRMEPLNDRLEQVTKRMFPDVRAGGGIFGAGVEGGLPNEFLVTAGDDPRDREIMRIRTSETAGPDAPPPGHYMRSGTFSDYDGRGWDNPGGLIYREGRANQPVIEEAGAGRQTLVQNVFLTFNARVLYAAGEPVEPSIAYRAAFRGPDDLVLLSAPARTYTVVSQTPAVSDNTLAQAAGWGDPNPLPDAFAMHLALPDTVTPRTRALAAELTDGLSSPYAKAQAIEQYLRAYEYDLTVPLPPEGIVDITDYFLFELQRGYCDYYATAFVVLARLAGLPTRFATGFAVGSWDSRDMTFVVTEAEAHSWPEVYFPDYGWIPFEPTGGRPELVRPEARPDGGSASPPIAEPDLEESPATRVDWNWQMLFWLLPLGLLIWGIGALVRQVARRNQDPWQSMLHWGRRAGRPIADDETVLEYGRGLGAFILQEAAEAQDTRRRAAREVVALSKDVADARYGMTDARPAAIDRAMRRWQSLRAYLRAIR